MTNGRPVLDTGTPAARRPRPTARRIAALALAGLAYSGLVLGGHWVAQRADMLLSPRLPAPDDPVMTGVLVAAVATYIVATALPFVPGAEIGLTLIMLLGARIVPVVYVATVAALVLAFLVGRHVPERQLSRLLAGVGLRRAAKLAADIRGMDEGCRLRHLAAVAPTGWLPWVLRHRFLGLALLINLPGNTILGGGGGLALLAGTSRTMSPSAFTLCVLLAVSPIPIAVLLFGYLP